LFELKAHFGRFHGLPQDPGLVQLPVIMFSAREGEFDKQKCAACGANDYPTKPFILKELLAQVKSLLK
jgi:DNA-binding response OmpR family regulator